MSLMQLAVATATVGLVLMPGQNQQPSVMALLDQYREGHFEEFEVALANVGDFQAVVRDIEAAPFDTHPRADAAFLLELTAAALRSQVRPRQPRNAFLTWRRRGPRVPEPSLDYLPLFAVAYRAMSRVDADDDFKHLWSSAAVALLQGANESPVQQAWPGVGGRMLGDYDLGKDGGYLRRLEPYLSPADLLLAEAAASEAQVWTRVNYDLPTYAGQPIPGANTFYTRLEGAFKRALDTAERLLTRARALPEVAAEATVRLGAVRLARGTVEARDAAIELFREAQAMEAPPEIAYLALLFEGKALDQAGALLETAEPYRRRRRDENADGGDATRLAQTVEAYRRARDVMPQAYSGRVALAGALFRQGQLTEAAALVNLAITNPDSEPDPWSLFWYGQYRHWPQRLAALREATR